MNEQRSFERFVADNVAGTSQGIPLPDDFYDDMHSFATTNGQRPEWLALIKEPPMRTNSRTTVGSPTVRVVAILAATMLLILAIAAAGAGAQRLLAADARIVVAEDGSGDYSTISEAVADAADGDKILIRPGVYAESIATDKSISLTGDGPPSAIVITHAEDGPLYSTGGIDGDESSTAPGDGWIDAGYALALVGTTANVTNVTFSGEDARLFIDGGSPVIEDVTFDGVGQAHVVLPEAQTQASYRVPSMQALIITGDATPTVRGNAFAGGGGIDIYTLASPRIERNSLEGGGIVGSQWGFGEGTRIIDNHLFGPGWQGIDLLYDAAVTVRGNLVEDRAYGLFLTGPALAEENEIRNSSKAAIYSMSSGPTIRDNRLLDNEVAVQWTRGDGIIEANKVGGGTDGILIAGGSPAVRDNVVEGVTERGIVVETMSTPVLTGNRSCGNGEDLHVMNLARPEVDASNEICDGSGA